MGKRGMVNDDKHVQEGYKQHEAFQSKRVKKLRGNNKSQEQERDAKSFQKRWASLDLAKKIEAWIGVAGLFFAAILAVTAILQMCAMREQLDEMRNGSRDTQTIAESARIQTENTIKLADASIASTAAWIAVESWDYKGIQKDHAVFQVVLKNVGKTPATNVTTGWEFLFSKGQDLTILKRDPWQCPETSSSPGIVPPDKTWVTFVNTPVFPAEQLKMLERKEARVFIHGCAKYHDVLSDKERITQIGVFYPPLLNDTGKNLGIYAPYSRMK